MTTDGSQEILQLEYKLALNLVRVKFLLDTIKNQKFPNHLRWYYLGRLEELTVFIEQDVKRLVNIRRQTVR